ncbi:ABC transporter permease [Nocardia yunnanensis]|uniref:ABC transporter permease n=1 Tax=Nocardia yunnanensis TaxID=2382165 RepID=A0A386Z935_9NOCA|nr:ABC transporter permease [Nocardia yunnanensis]AYF74146.1 ABC transporter permease [Nocardia yunnanensis]
MLTVLWLRGLIRLRSGRLLGATAGIAVAVALLAALGSFLSASEATMTERSIQRVAVDWQVQVEPGADAAVVLNTVTADPAVARALPVGFGTATGLHSTVDGATLSTGSARILGLPTDYTSLAPTQIRHLTGSRDGVLVTQQTAANLHIAPGEAFTIERQDLPPVTLTVAGIVDLPKADSLFQSIGAPRGAQPTATPDSVVLLPAEHWHALFDPLAVSHPDQARTQIHVQTHHDLPADPAAAYNQISGAARHLEATLAGGGLVGDNLGAVLGAARADALYAHVLFLFLGVPAAVLATVLTATVTGSGADRRRSEQALLRIRGADTAHLLRLAMIEAAAVGVAGSLLGIGAALLLGEFAFGSGGFGATPTAVVGWTVAAAAIGIGIALATVFLPARRDLLTPAGVRGAARWMRWGLDYWLLAGAAAVWLATRRTGYQLVLAPEGVPQISVSYWAFAAPALLWLGSALLYWRLTTVLLRSGRPLLTRLLRPLTGTLSGTGAALLSRQYRMIARAVVLLALTIAFACSTAVFNATYQQQAEADAQLTNGADVTVTEPPSAAVPASATTTIEQVPGVRSVEPLQHRFAYVGADLQDLYGIRPATVGSNLRLSDAYFSGGTARQLVDRLAHHPDDILVSQETVNDFQLRLGDTLRLRLVDAGSGQQITVPFHYAGVVKEFPTAPKDSFLVANADYIATRTGSPAVGAFLITTNGTPVGVVADRVRSALGPGPTVTDIQSTRSVVGSSLTAVDLSGLTRVELGFAILLATAATGLQLLLGFSERRRLFALTSLLGARSRLLASLVWAEIAVTVLTATVLGAALGWVLSELLVAVLTGVFDPPPTNLAVPWGYLGIVALAAVGATVAAGARAVQAARRPALDVLRDL